LQDKKLLASHLHGNHAMIITNEVVAKYYLAELEKALVDKGFNIDTLILADGEQYKTLTTLELIYNQLLEKQHDRKTTLIALGGGVIGDMTGFAAATYRRGVNFLQLPTTLLAQVDAAIGGKTAVNHKLGKNMIGAFYQPEAVICDIHTLKTLPEREFIAGLAEVVKYALIADSSFFYWLKQNIKSISNRDEAALEKIIYVCAKIKAEIVSQDETEMGQRAILNFGHTFGHVLEALTDYKTFLHGEAVAIGMLLALDLSIRLKKIKPVVYAEVKALLKTLQLPTELPKTISLQAFLQGLYLDKKVLNKQLRFIILSQLGHAEIIKLANEALLQKLLEDFGLQG
ncbi:MAG: 3-dehydroquinate synthase, partial [Pseudomonadota bacterium]